MSEHDHHDLQDTPGTEEETGNPEAAVGEDAVPNDLPGPGDPDRGHTRDQPSAVR